MVGQIRCVFTACIWHMISWSVECKTQHNVDCLLKPQWLYDYGQIRCVFTACIWHTICLSWSETSEIFPPLVPNHSENFLKSHLFSRLISYAYQDQNMIWSTCQFCVYNRRTMLRINRRQLILKAGLQIFYNCRSRRPAQTLSFPPKRARSSNWTFFSKTVAPSKFLLVGEEEG